MKESITSYESIYEKKTPKIPKNFNLLKPNVFPSSTDPSNHINQRQI